MVSLIFVALAVMWRIEFASAREREYTANFPPDVSVLAGPAMPQRTGFSVESYIKIALLSGIDW